MFLTAYLKAMFQGTGKQAFDSGKVFSDIMAMVNRAVWLVTIALLLPIADNWIGNELSALERFAFQVTRITVLFVFPTVLVCQIYMIGARSLAESFSGRRLTLATVSFTVVWLVLNISFMTTASIVQRGFLARQDALSEAHEISRTLQRLEIELEALKAHAAPNTEGTPSPAQ